MEASGSVGAWVTCPRPRAAAAVRLVCIPYAGGGASAFVPWVAEAEDVELWLAQLPGRERRFLEAPVTSMEGIVGPLAAAIRAQVPGPYALFGHSMGALLALETARRLRRHPGAEPVHVFVSGATPPQMTWPVHAHRLADPDLREWMARLGGVPSAVLADPELVELVLPILRADLQVCETYEFRDEAPLSCPITALAGCDDPLASPSVMAAWSAHTAGAFNLLAIPGGHFFLNEHRRAVVSAVTEELQRQRGNVATVAGARP